MRGGELSRLKPIRADDLSGVFLLDEQVIAVGVVSVFVAPERVRCGEPFAEFEIEDLEAQPLSGVQVFRSRGEAETIAGSLPRA